MTQTDAIEELTALVEQELVDILSDRDMPLYRMMFYHLGWEDEQGQPISSPRSRTHGVACLLASAFAGGDRRTALPAAAAVEMIANFSQIHDDVQDGNPKRGDRNSVWWVWGPAQAINAGDGMHALARLALLGLQDRGVTPYTAFRAAQMLDQTCLEMCEGRFRDLELLDRIDTSQEAYFIMAAGKTGALMGGAMQLGALVASEDDAVTTALGQCGSKIGVGLQIREDIRALWGEGAEAEPGTDALNKKKLLPLVYALEHAGPTEKRRLGEVYFKRVLQPEDVDVVREVVEGLGALEYCEGLVDRYRQEAMDALQTAGRSVGDAADIERFALTLLEPKDAGG